MMEEQNIQIILIKKYISKKTGEEKIYSYNQKFYNDTFYKKNKDKILLNHKDKLYEKIMCDCGGYYLINNKNIHLRTKKHQLFINNKNDIV